LAGEGRIDKFKFSLFYTKYKSFHGDRALPSEEFLTNPSFYCFFSDAFLGFYFYKYIKNNWKKIVIRQPDGEMLD
jgi:hypothetical protein